MKTKLLKEIANKCANDILREEYLENIGNKKEKYDKKGYSIFGKDVFNIYKEKEKYHLMKHVISIERRLAQIKELLQNDNFEEIETHIEIAIEHLDALNTELNVFI